MRFFENKIRLAFIIGAVSPPGGDLSDPVVQATLRVVKVFWGLEAKLAYRRHFPSINWLISYSLSSDTISNYYDSVAPDFISNRQTAMRLLQEESELEEIVRLVGIDTLSESDRLTLEVSRSIREDFLHQNAFHEIDTYASINKQYKMLKTIINFYEKSKKALENGISFLEIKKLESAANLSKMRYLPEERINEIDLYIKLINEEIDVLAGSVVANTL